MCVCFELCKEKKKFEFFYISIFCICNRMCSVEILMLSDCWTTLSLAPINAYSSVDPLFNVLKSLPCFCSKLKMLRIFSIR